MSSLIEVNEGNEHVQVDLPQLEANTQENEKDISQPKEVRRKRNMSETSPL